jgi:hypothetical protein
MYDFKINKTLIMLEPNDKNVNIGVDVLIDRTDQGKATQVRSTVTSDEGYIVYASLTLNKTTLQDATKTEWERLYYWISFPFDVRISEVGARPLFHLTVYHFFLIISIAILRISQEICK